MKIQTKATIKSLSVNGKVAHPNDQVIDLEFSAIDSGGGFKDPILDFSFKIDNSQNLESARKKGEIILELVDPRNQQNKATLAHKGVNISDNEINGRLKDDQLERSLIGFVLQLLR